MRLFLMLCLILSGALSYAHNTGTTEKEIGRGIPIEIIEAINVSGLAKSNAIIPTLDGHLLTVVFSENLGQVAVVVTACKSTSPTRAITSSPSPFPTGMSTMVSLR